MSDFARSACSYRGQSVVFIDLRTPDLQALIDGLKPGERAFVLDPSSDGVQQIADIPATNNLTNLTSISIVGHEAPSGAIELGSTVLNDADLSQEAVALAKIGSSIAPGGDLALYSCDTAATATGRQFIADLSHYAGGVDVAAATHLVGSTDLGGSWTLDATTGAPDRINRRAVYPGEPPHVSRVVLGIGFSSQSTSSFPDPQAAGRVVVGDFSGDGAADILFQTGGNGTPFEYALNNGNGTFTIESLANSPFAGLTLPDDTGNNYRVGDFNGDGASAIYASSNGTSGTVYLNEGSSFTAVTATGLPNLTIARATVVGDFTGDGKTDILFEPTGTPSGGFDLAA